MRGHEAIIRMRKEYGKKPPFVFINDYPCQTDWFEEGIGYARISIHGDKLESLDLRFLVGLSVSVTASSEKRSKALFEACKSVGVAQVVATHIDPTRKPWEQRSEVHVYKREAVNG